MGLIISLVRSTLCHVPKRMDARGGGSKTIQSGSTRMKFRGSKEILTSINKKLELMIFGAWILYLVRFGRSKSKNVDP